METNKQSHVLVIGREENPYNFLRKYSGNLPIRDKLIEIRHRAIRNANVNRKRSIFTCRQRSSETIGPKHHLRALLCTRRTGESRIGRLPRTYRSICSSRRAHLHARHKRTDLIAEIPRRTDTTYHECRRGYFYHSRLSLDNLRNSSNSICEIVFFFYFDLLRN